MTRILSLFIALTMGISGFASKWDLDESHSAAKFKIRHMMVSNVGGQITGVKGTLEVDDKDAAKLSGTVTLDPSTINTSNSKRDLHLQDADFFDVKKFPTILFKIGKVSKVSGGKLNIAGDLTMHGVTQPVTIENAELTPAIKDANGNSRRGLSGKAKIERKKFGLTWNKALDGGGIALGDDVEVEVEAELTAKK